MSKNYDLIATVDIDIASPLVDDTSFDNLLIVGPLPKVAPEKAPPKVGTYSSMDEVLEAGWTASGDDADPIGVAAQVAFGQSPRPTTLYIAPQQLTAAAVVAGKTIEAVNSAIDEYAGKKEGLTGCSIAYDEGTRVLCMTLTGPVSGVKNTGLFDMLSALSAAGYTATIDGTAITDGNSFMSLPVFREISDLEEGGEAVQFIIELHAPDSDEGVPYGVIVQRPGAVVATSQVPDFTAEPIDNPQNEVESAVETVQRAVSSTGWYVVCTAGVDPAEYEEIAAYIETQERMFCYTELGFFGAGEDGTDQPTVGTVYYRTKGIYGRETTDQADEDIPPANLYMNVAAVAKWLNYESGSETSAFKTLASVYPSELTTTEMRALADANLDYFITVGNKNITMNGKVVAGEWADIIRFRDWLKNDMQVRVVNLFITNPKIPYTDSGIGLVQNQMLASLKAGQDVGGIAEDEFDEDGNTIPGYQTSVPLAATISASDKASRRLTNCKFKARLAGAIHFAELTGSLTYEL